MSLAIPASRTARLGLLILALFMVALPACDAVETGNTITLPQKTVEFEFRQNASSGNPPATLTIASDNSVDLSSLLEGFQKSEVVSVTITRIELERIQPSDRQLSDLMDRVQLQLNASGVPNVTVGEQNSLPSTRETTLGIVAADITDHAVRPDFSASLGLTNPVAVNYVLAARLDLRIEVEDF